MMISRCPVFGQPGVYRGSDEAIPRSGLSLFESWDQYCCGTSSGSGSFSVGWLGMVTRDRRAGTWGVVRRAHRDSDGTIRRHSGCDMIVSRCGTLERVWMI
jgi:hypothetical protein